MTRCALLSWLGRTTGGGYLATGKAVLGLPRAACVLLRLMKYPHRKSKCPGVQPPGTHGPAPVDEWHRKAEAAASPRLACPAPCSPCKTSGASKRIATDHRKRQPPQASRGPQRFTERVAPQEAQRHARTRAAQRQSAPKGVAPPRGTHARTMTQWSPVKGANLLVDPRAQQRKERREQRYPAPPVPPVEPPPTYDFSTRFRKPHATRGGADFGRSSVRARRPGRARRWRAVEQFRDGVTARRRPETTSRTSRRPSASTQSL